MAETVTMELTQEEAQWVLRRRAARTLTPDEHLVLMLEQRKAEIEERLARLYEAAQSAQRKLEKAKNAPISQPIEESESQIQPESIEEPGTGG